MAPQATTTFSWLDYDEEETRKARELYAALDSESVDALGLGSIRDGFANLLFPGTSTIQTRVRYFVLVPYAAQAVARRRPRDARQFDKWFHDAELATMAALKATTKSGDGVIGAVAGRDTKRLPSDVYWNGIARWGLIRSRQDTSAELSSLAGYRAWVLSGNQRHLDEADEVTTVTPFFDELPPPPPGFPGEKLSILPRKDEARYLLDRMQQLTVTVNQTTGEQASTLLSAMAADPKTGAMHSIFDLDPSLLAPHTARVLRQAQGFSTVMQGARLLYNRMLFEKFEDADLGLAPRSIDKLTDLEDRWVTIMTTDRDQWEQWRTGLDDIFPTLRRAGVSISTSAQRFVRDWTDIAVGAPQAALESDACRSAVQLREAVDQTTRHGQAHRTNRPGTLAGDALRNRLHGLQVPHRTSPRSATAGKRRTDMLGPDDRHTLTSLLTPPPGATLDAAIGTTYTLNLDAFMVVPALLTLTQVPPADENLPTPLELLDSLRRTSRQDDRVHPGRPDRRTDRITRPQPVRVPRTRHHPGHRTQEWSVPPQDLGAALPPRRRPLHPPDPGRLPQPHLRPLLGRRHRHGRRRTAAPRCSSYPDFLRALPGPRRARNHLPQAPRPASPTSPTPSPQHASLAPPGYDSMQVPRARPPGHQRRAHAPDRGRPAHSWSRHSSTKRLLERIDVPWNQLTVVSRATRPERRTRRRPRLRRLPAQTGPRRQTTSTKPNETDGPGSNAVPTHSACTPSCTCFDRGPRTTT